MKKLLFISVLILLNNAKAQGFELGKQLDQYINHEIKTNKIPGMSIVIIKNGKIVYTQGYGFANIANKRPMTANTPIIIGSTTKAMTALAIMQLVEQEKINLDRPVKNYISWFKVDDPRSDLITVRHLLNHTAGLPAGVDLTGDNSDQALENRVRWLSKSKLLSNPGQVFTYANDGYSILGLIIQQVSGMRYENYMQNNVFAKLNMNKTTFDLKKAIIIGLAQGYIRFKQGFLPISTPISAGSAPAGLVTSTANDIGHYLESLLADKNEIISRQSLTQMWNPNKSQNDASYGFGWAISELEGTKMVTHEGDIFTSSSLFTVFPKTKFAIALLSNIGNTYTRTNSQIFQGIISIMSGQNPKLTAIKDNKPPNNFVDDKNLRVQYIGKYSSDGFEVEIYRKNDLLLAKGDFNGLNFSYELEAKSDNTFIAYDNTWGSGESDIKFEVNAADKTTLLWTSFGETAVFIKKSG